MTSNNMICLCTDSWFVVQEYARFLRRWQVDSVFFAQQNLSSKKDDYGLWVNQEDYITQTKNKRFVDEESQLTGLLSNAKKLIKNLEKSCKTNEQLIRANEQLLGFAS